MKNKFKIITKYLVMILVTGFLLWLSFKNIIVSEDANRFEYILDLWNNSNKFFIILSGLSAILSHIVRAARWNLLLKPIGYPCKLFDSFISVMTGYFINLAIPRGGEVSRCYNLFKLNKTPINISLGTVIGERVIDMIVLLFLITISFILELDNLVLFFESQQLFTFDTINYFYIILVICGVSIFIFGIWIGFRFLLKKKRYTIIRLMIKSKGSLMGIKSGVKSVLFLKNKMLFIFYSLAIWILYYFMMYFVMLAFTETENLGLIAALTIFVIGAVGMLIPLPGGAGSFHVLVSSGLVLLYFLPQNKAVAFTFIFHSWQTLVIIIVGLISMIVSYFYGIKVSKHGR